MLKLLPMKNLKLITIILITFFAFSCKKDKPNNTDKPASYVLAPKSVIIDNPSSQIIQAVDSVKVVFNGNTTQLESLTVGNIIISGIAPNAPYGFLRKITNIQKTGTTYTFTTVEVPLEEAFEELHVDYTKTFSTSDTARRVTGSSFTIDLPNMVLYDGDGNNATTADQIKLNENVEITPSFRFAVDITRFKLQYAIVEGNYETILDQSIVAGGSVGSMSKEVNVFEKPLAAYPLPGLPFLVVVPNLRVSLGATASINVSVAAAQKITSNINAYIEYKNSTWDKDYTQTMQTTHNFSGINGNASIKVYVEPAIDFKLYNSNWAKGSISAQGYLKATGTLLPTPDCELKAGLSAGAEANLKFFGWGFTAASYPDIFDYSKVLYTCVANQTPIADFSASHTAITTGSSVNFTDLSTGSPTSWSWSFQGGTPVTSTLQNPTNIQYNTAGTYNVTLITTNANGNDTETKTGYIIVSDPNPQLPTLTTTAISNIANTTATSGGNITNQGSSAVTARGVCWSTSQNPTIANSKTTDGSETGSFTSNLTGLTTNTTYYVRAYATNSAGTAYGNQQSFTTTGTTTNCGTVTDIDGNVYNTVTIGTQCWMVENLKTTRYKDGSTIPTGLSNSEWLNTTSGAYAIYNNEPANNITYGKLYNWYAVNTGKLAPTGWHVPTEAELHTLITYLGGSSVAGGKMKSTTLWKSPNTGATNSSGFTCLPSGARFNDGAFFFIEESGFYWSSTLTNGGIYKRLFYNSSNTYSDYSSSGNNGFSVRCIKD
jgi:uncharacterized protein (TIGR02145 family)